MTPPPAESALPRQPSVDGRMCSQCGPDVLTDEDGCCNTCGADTAPHMDVRRWFAADAHALAESRAECERLRPKRVDVPTEPGWYWARFYGDRHVPVEVRPYQAKVGTHLLGQPFDTESVFELKSFTDWYGPLDPPSAALAAQGASP